MSINRKHPEDWTDEERAMDIELSQMTKFSLWINCENEAFNPDSGIELAAILRKLASKLEDGGLDTGTHRLMDSNGNAVGQWVVE